MINYLEKETEGKSDRQQGIDRERGRSVGWDGTGRCMSASTLATSGLHGIQMKKKVFGIGSRFNRDIR